MMMMVKKCIWNVQPDAAAHFFPSTQSMNHRADENAPRRCTRFFSSYLTALHYDELFFWASQCSAHTQWSEGLSVGFILLLHSMKLWVEADLIDAVLAISTRIRNSNKCYWADFLFFCKCVWFVFDFSKCHGHCFLSFTFLMVVSWILPTRNILLLFQG